MSSTVENLHESNSRSFEEETEEETYDNHLADSATATLNREIDSTLEENSGHVLVGIDEALDRIETGHSGPVRAAEADRRGSTRGPPVRNEVYRLPASRREGLVNPSARLIDVRVGSATDGRVPISMVERSLSATPFHWIGLLAVAFATVIADQVTKQIVVSQLELGESVNVLGPLEIRHVTNPGIAFRLFSNWATAVTLLTALAVGWMLFYFARSGARHPVLPVALGLLVGAASRT